MDVAFLATQGVPLDALRAVARFGARLGVAPHEVLIKHGLVSEDAYYRALAAHLRLPFLAKPRVSEEARFPQSIAAGLAPLAGEGARFALAPTGGQVARLLASRRPFESFLAITTPSLLTRAVIAARGDEIRRHASGALALAAPALSSHWRLTRAQARLGLLAGALSLALAFAAPALLAWGFGLLFSAIIALRLSTAFTRRPIRPPGSPARREDEALPVYSVIVPLRDEGGITSQLVSALERLDYPPAKLDIKLVIEADDPGTPASLARLNLPSFMEVIVAPPGLPRTKPRALNVVLPLARGAYTVIYDAEDVPEPAQLRLAVEAFARSGPEVACLQARLTIDNTADSWLTRLFTLEYATLFDVVNPGLARMGSPVLLGGTSNHFRTEVLREIHGWDAWNVTEDADLGIRLARLGYGVEDLPSSTFEEAPATLRKWLAQRTRWMKGYLQTTITHAREPREAFRQLGPARFSAAFLMTFGAVTSALAYLPLTLHALLGLAVGRQEMGPLLALSLALGSAAILAPTLCAMHRRGLWSLLPWTLLIPVYYGLIGIAAWRGLIEFIRAPHRWNKTEHGLALTSRSGLLRKPETSRALRSTRPARPSWN